MGKIFVWENLTSSLWECQQDFKTVTQESLCLGNSVIERKFQAVL